MNGPARFSLGFGADGIVFATWKVAGLEIPSDLYLSRCRQTFNPPSNSGWNQVIPWENQFVVEEYTLGANAALRPVSYGTNNWQLPINKDGRGIFCFFDKLYFESFYFASISNDNKDKGTHIALYAMECLFQPVKVERWDYFEMLLKRMQCSNTCIKQNVNFWPCVDETQCISSKLANIKDDDIVTLVKSYDTGIGGVKVKEFKLTGKEYKERKKTLNDDPDYDQYIEVKVVGSQDLICIELSKQLEICKDALKSCQQGLANANQIIDNLNDVLSKLRKENGDLYLENVSLKEQVAKLTEQNDSLTKENAQLTKDLQTNITCCQTFKNMSIGEIQAKYLKYQTPLITKLLRDSSEQFDKSFIPILESYMKSIDYSSPSKRNDSFKIYSEYKNIPIISQGPIAPWLIFLKLHDYFARDSMFKSKTSRSGMFNGEGNSQSINYFNYLNNLILDKSDMDVNLSTISPQVGSASKDTPPGTENEQTNSQNEHKRFGQTNYQVIKSL